MEKNLLDLSLSAHASLCTLARMLSALNALSIPRGREPSQAILELILQTSLFSCFSLSRHLITSLGKSLSFSALKPDKQQPNNSAIPLFLVYTFPYINPARKNYLSSVSDITQKPSDLFGLSCCPGTLGLIFVIFLLLYFVTLFKFYSPSTFLQSF